MPTFLEPINLNKNELQNPRAQNLGAEPSSPVAGQFFWNTVLGQIGFYDGAGWVYLGAGTGTVLDVSVATANGFAGTSDGDDDNPTITISTTVTGLLKGNGTAISAAVAGTDYLAPNGNGSALTGITVSQVSGAAPLASPTFTGTPIAPTAAANTNTTQVATTAYVQSELADYALLASPTFTGTPTAPTAAAATNTTQLATTAFVQTAIAALINSAPGVLDTLDEIAAALGDDPNFAATITTSLAGKQPLDATLTALSGATTAADTLVYFSGVDTTAVTTLTSFARTFLDDTTAAAARTTLGATGKYSALVGDGSATSIAITQATHGLASNAQMHVALYDASSGSQVYPGVSINNSNGTVTLTFAVAPTSNQYRVVLIG